MTLCSMYSGLRMPSPSGRCQIPLSVDSSRSPSRRRRGTGSTNFPPVRSIALRTYVEAFCCEVLDVKEEEKGSKVSVRNQTGFMGDAGELCGPVPG
ncbi:hypothetical protein KSP40_PGU004806 [Platanthera guangdongensis]|uniref:Uncharacterized protein n=1 Tax=Platanthera guangdongensis TaxID=2320717 RepID=A0ABR2N1Y4_9ASPA